MITFLFKPKDPQNSEKNPKKLVKIILNLTILMELECFF